MLMYFSCTNHVQYSCINHIHNFSFSGGLLLNVALDDTLMQPFFLVHSNFKNDVLFRRFFIFTIEEFKIKIKIEISWDLMYNL